MLDQFVAVSFLSEKQSRFRSTFFNVIVKTKSTGVFYRLYSYIDHKNDSIKCSKQGEQSTFLLLWVVFCCGKFWFDGLK